VYGRIKRERIQAKLAKLAAQVDKDVVCPLCERPISPSQRDAHHLIPKSHGGKQTVLLHRICHRQIHAIFSESELARRLNSVECLKATEELQSFIKWVSSKPDDFFGRTFKSHRLKSPANNN